jgi:hypothetical protein
MKMSMDSQAMALLLQAVYQGDMAIQNNSSYKKGSFYIVTDKNLFKLFQHLRKPPAAESKPFINIKHSMNSQ